MTKYKFRCGDVVRTVPDGEGRSVVGKVTGFSTGSGYQWFKVTVGADVYNCREDEIELRGRRTPEVTAVTTLLWYDAARAKPRDGMRCAVITRFDSARILIGVFHAGDEDVRAHFRTADDGIVMVENAVVWAEWSGIGEEIR